jgi:hypothetical protein
MAKTTKNQFFLLFFAGMIVALVGIVVGVYAGIGLVLLLGVLFYHARYEDLSSVASHEDLWGTKNTLIAIFFILFIIMLLIAWIGIMFSDFFGYVDWGL